MCSVVLALMMLWLMLWQCAYLDFTERHAFIPRVELLLHLLNSNLKPHTLSVSSHPLPSPHPLPTHPTPPSSHPLLHPLIPTYTLLPPSFQHLAKKTTFFKFWRAPPPPPPPPPLTPSLTQSLTHTLSPSPPRSPSPHHVLLRLSVCALP